MKSPKIIQSLIMLLVVLAFTPLIQGGCGGGGGGSDSLPVDTEETGDVNASGVWDMHEEIDATACDGNSYTEDYQLTITQNGNMLTVSAPEGNYDGSVDGSEVTWNGTYYDSESHGWVTVTHATITFIDDNCNGSIYWEFRDSQEGPVVCSGTSSATGTRVPGTKNEIAISQIYDDPDDTNFLNDLFNSNLTIVDFDDIDTSSGAVIIAGTEYADWGITFTKLASEPMKVEPLYSYYPDSNYLSIGGRPYQGGDSLNDSLVINIPAGATAVGWTFFDAGNGPDESITFYDKDGKIIYEQDWIPERPSGSYTSFFGIISDTPVYKIEIIDAPYDSDDIGYDNFVFVSYGSAPVYPGDDEPSLVEIQESTENFDPDQGISWSTVWSQCLPDLPANCNVTSATLDVVAQIWGWGTSQDVLVSDTNAFSYSEGYVCSFTPSTHPDPGNFYTLSCNLDANHIDWIINDGCLNVEVSTLSDTVYYLDSSTLEISCSGEENNSNNVGEDYVVTLGQDKVFTTFNVSRISGTATSDGQNATSYVQVGSYEEGFSEAWAGVTFQVAEGAGGLTASDAVISITLSYDLEVDFDVLDPSESGGGSADARLYTWISNLKTEQDYINFIHYKNYDQKSGTTTFSHRLSDAPTWNGLAAGQTYEVTADLYTHAQVYKGNTALASANVTVHEVRVEFD